SLTKSSKPYKAFVVLVHIVPNHMVLSVSITRILVRKFIHESRSRKGSFPITDSNLLSNPKQSLNICSCKIKI
uniref:Uncharacterized protein n=1 Tax=Kalanchoe fedtschenkoi TaxID=63787 RepID=A0A7N0RAT0_KALFE